MEHDVAQTLPAGPLKARTPGTAGKTEIQGARIWVAGHGGMVGRAVMRALQDQGAVMVTANRHDLDLRDQASVGRWALDKAPDMIVMAAAHVGGILANSRYPATFFYDNMAMTQNVIHTAYELGVKRLLFLGSSCVYPPDAVQPLSPSALLSAPLEKTNEAYALAKIAGVRMCEYYRQEYGCDFFAAMPCNLYGPGDRYDFERSHVIPALIMKMHGALRQKLPEVRVWGTGRPLREFMHVDDLAAALVFLLRNYTGNGPVNVGAATEISIADLARKVAECVGYKGRILFDGGMPDGAPRKKMDCRELTAMGWFPRINLKEGLAEAYNDYLMRITTAEQIVA